LDIGCTQIDPRLITEKNHSSHADDREQCKEKCARDFLYYLFNASTLQVYCLFTF